MIEQPGLFPDHAVQQTVNEVFSVEALQTGLKRFLPQPLVARINHQVAEGLHSIREFQRHIVHHLVDYLELASTSGLSVSGWENLDPTGSYLFISNHRDIVLDSAFLNNSLFRLGFQTSQIAIGDNLMKHRLAELIFYLNKSFVVKRSGTAMELYRYSVKMSQYIAKNIQNNHDSVWIAQREGRAKDGNDSTQVGLLKMLSLAAEGDLQAFFKKLNIVPVSISYEYNPCDALLMHEHLKKIKNPDFQKTFEEDLAHITQGLFGQKGRVHLHFDKPLNQELDVWQDLPNDKARLNHLAKLLDAAIQGNYHLHPINYVAYNLLGGEKAFSEQFSEKDKSLISAYFDQKFGHLTGEDFDRGREYLLSMYANPLKNRMKVLGV